MPTEHPALSRAGEAALSWYEGGAGEGHLHCWPNRSRTESFVFGRGQGVEGSILRWVTAEICAIEAPPMAWLATGTGAALTSPPYHLRPTTQVPDDVLNAGRRMATLLRIGLGGCWTCHRTVSALSDVSTAELVTVISLLDEARLGRFLDATCTHPSVAELLAQKFPGEPFLESLVALSRWNLNRDSASSIVQAGSEFDWLAHEGRDGTPRTFAQRLSFAARKQILPRHRCGVLAAASNEGPHLLEWIAHYRALGFDQIALYSNGNVDGSDLLLSALARAGVIIWVDNPTNPGSSAQLKAYGHALGLLPHVLDCEWTLLADLDEFLCLDWTRFASVTDYVTWQERQNVDAISLHWLMFASLETLGRGMTNRFSRRLDYIDMHVKTFFRTALFNHAGAHVPHCDGRTGPVVRSSEGDLIKHQLGGMIDAMRDDPVATGAWINHYLFRSPDEMLVKWLRNRGDGPVSTEAKLHLNSQIVSGYIDQHDSVATVEDRRIQVFDPARDAEFDWLLTLPNVSDAMKVIDTRHACRVAQARRLLTHPAQPYDEGGAGDLLSRHLGLR